MYIIGIIIVSLLSLHKVLGFYFWHDDYSIIYTARTGECLFKWPYTSYCHLFPFLDKFFNYNPLLYFGFGVVMSIFTSIVIYSFAKDFFSKNISFLLACFFSTAYIGAGAYLESYSVITTFLSLNFLFLSLKCFVRQKVFLGIVLIIVATQVLEARSATYGVIASITYYLFSKKEKLSKRVFLTSLIFLVQLISYILNYFIINTTSTSSITTNYSWVLNINILQKINVLFQNISFILLNDQTYLQLTKTFNNSQIDLVYLIVGIFFVVFYFISLLKIKDKNLKKVRLYFALVCFLLYFQYGLVTEVRLDAVHRYLIFMFLGIILCVGTYYKSKILRYLLVILIINGIISTNNYFEKYLKMGRDRQYFYVVLKKTIPVIRSNSVFYFEFSKDFEYDPGDFFRVGHEGPEASLATEYAIKMVNLKLIDKNEVVKYKDCNCFYYDGHVLKKLSQL